MSNMDYCRFTNTAADMDDCLDVFCDPVGSTEEHRSRKRFVKVCAEIIFDYADAKTLEEALEWADSLPLEEDAD